MTTKVHRGRDPEQHVVHATRAEADRFKGMHGEITLVADGTTDPGSIVELRAHNGVKYGGFAIPLTDSGATPTPLPVSRVVPPMAVTTTGADEAVVVEHGLGYFPMVQVLDNTGLPVAAPIQHHDDQSLSVTIAAAGDYEIILR